MKYAYAVLAVVGLGLFFIPSPKLQADPPIPCEAYPPPAPCGCPDYIGPCQSVSTAKINRSHGGDTIAINPQEQIWRRK